MDVFERRDWKDGTKHFEIETNAGNLGTKARFVVDAKTGEIVSGGYVPREVASASAEVLTGRSA